MVLDDLQTRVMRLIAANRGPESVVAGGAVIQRSGPRLSDDLDLFHTKETDVPLYARLDMETLRKAGLEATITRDYPGFIEAVIGSDGVAPTKLQWTVDSEWRFLRPVQDQAFGYRLQTPDLAVNKIVAAATRGEARDFVDVAFLDKHVMPLWAMVWAAPGKDDSFTPIGYLDQILRRSATKVHEIKDLSAVEPLDGPGIRNRLVSNGDFARTMFEKLPPASVGHLFTLDGTPVLNPDPKVATSNGYGILPPGRGGAWPQIPEVISQQILSLRDEIGKTRT